MAIISPMVRASLLLVLGLLPLGAAGAEEIITWGTVGSGSATQWPLYIGAAKGYYAE
jgi:ABC-type nitrate/sulfonate/bicarbonate transport system substrate-binding protein